MTLIKAHAGLSLCSSILKFDLRNSHTTTLGPIIWIYAHIKPYKSFSGIYANSADPDQTPQNVDYDQGIHCLLTKFSIINRTKMKIPENIP